MESFLGSALHGAAAVFLCVAALLGLVIWSIKRHNSPKLKIESCESIDELIPSLAGLTLSSAVAGNSVALLENGAFFDVLIGRIGAAQQNVHFETFLWKDGVLGQRMADALSERARAGVKVRVLLDATGCKQVGKATRRQMKDAGCKLVFFHEKALRNIGVLNERDHRKLVVIDGREAFVGGHCVVDEWLGNAEDGKHYADLSVHLHGPIVHSVQAAFSENWGGQTGELFLGKDVFPELAPAGNVTIHAAYAKPEGSAPAVKILHHTVICLAQKRIWIQNPYFIPEPEAIDAFGAAVKRGVDVRVMMPSTSGSDNPMVQHAGHRNFEKLLKCGVRLFEYPHTLLHQKVMTVDGVWSAIGSSNFDDRSFDTNDELTLGIKDAALTQQLDAVFEKYVQRCEEIDLKQWQQRGLWHKLKDNMFYVFNEIL
ncbi:MAG: phospholipase D-like domain-containing protein [Polaromonas sp.]|uniref:phospholipase D-like domain-containing protein n=1 Tax=Polaromonas sp. TaxID=1869339 RepID=UPI002733196E|nr:phospholipase D-like domain-containing protein [Polaromonas sp.]MDP3248186.1 phospholipase D-like domain-containing protein [Polaromonas sp.]MDP3757521.1 phospholipase D-like domain-containing protein [Polaromonas sp.]